MNVQVLMDAVGALKTEDALPARLSREDWTQLSRYLAVRFLNVGDVLIEQGEADRELYLLERGELQVTIRGTVVATLQPGNVVGEGSFFSGKPRSATITASQAGVAWALSWEKFEAFAQKHPRIALDLVRAVGTVLACRMREAILVGHFA